VRAPPDASPGARRLVGALDARRSPGAWAVHGDPPQSADADGLVRVLAQLLGLPPPPPLPVREHGSSFQRDSFARPGWGYDGTMGEPPPPPPEHVSGAPAAASTGGTASIPLEAPVPLPAGPAAD